MISKIITLNSELYSKAILELEIEKNINSIQLVAENNVGKSSLINALNFLFILDGRQMKFGGGHDLKSSINHYFPDANRSFLIFEMVKPAISYFCILIKRSLNNSALEYYYIRHHFDENHFFEKKGNTLTPLSFKVINDKFNIENIYFEKLEKAQIYDLIYNRDSKKLAVIWVDDRTKRMKSSYNNNFSEVYRYLINTNLITDRRLKEAFITANNRQNEFVNFAGESKEDLLRIEQLNLEIEKYKNLDLRTFDTLKNNVEDYQNEYDYLGKVLYNFNSRYEGEIINYQNEIIKLEKQKEAIEEEISKSEQDKSKINQTIGELKSNKNNFQKDLKKDQLTLEKIKALEVENDFNPLENQKIKLNRNQKTIERNLNEITRYDYTISILNREIRTLTNDVSRLSNKIKDYDNLLIHHISKDEKITRRLVNLLSKNIQDLPKETIKKPITFIDDKLNLFDGIIDITKIGKGKIESLNDLKEDFNTKSKQLEDRKEILKTLEKRQDKERELNELKKDIKQLEHKQELLQGKEDIVRKIERLEINLKNTKTQIVNQQNNVSDLQQDLKRFKSEETSINNSINGNQGYAKRVQNAAKELENYPVIEIEELLNLSVLQCADILKKHQEKLLNLKTQKNELFNELKKVLGLNYADIEVFIHEVEEQVASIVDKENSIELHLENISNQFTNSVKNLLEKFEEFKVFKNKFNRQISSYHISDITKVKLEILETKSELDKLRKISQIERLKVHELDFNNEKRGGDALSENLQILKKYIEDGRKVNFEELFDLELTIEKKGKISKVSIGKQVESEGTNMMIKLILFLSIIKYLVKEHEHNKVTIYIDELGKIGQHNVSEIIRFCKENNFYPIFAAPRPIEGVDKYYIIKPSSKNAKIVVDKRNAQRVTKN